jgi:ribosomal protein L37E
VVTERCPAGKYFDDEAGMCRSCGHGFYQPNEGSFNCLLCGLGKTTRTAEAVSPEVINVLCVNCSVNIIQLSVAQ